MKHQKKKKKKKSASVTVPRITCHCVYNSHFKRSFLKHDFQIVVSYDDARADQNSLYYFLIPYTPYLKHLITIVTSGHKHVTVVSHSICASVLLYYLLVYYFVLHIIVKVPRS